MTLPPVILNRQNKIATKMAYVQPKFYHSKLIYAGMPVLPVTFSMSVQSAKFSL